VADAFQTASAWLQGRRHEHLTRAVAYWRGAEHVDVLATVGRTEFEAATEVGVELSASRDYLIRAADLALGGSSIEPAAGDRIHETLGGVTAVFELAAPAGGPPWRWSDPECTVYRVHCKRVEVE
jgi:hypothetical protein